MSRLLLPSLIVAATLVAIITWETRSAWQSDTDANPQGLNPSGLASTMSKPSPADPVDAWVTTSLERPLLRESRRPDKTAVQAQRKGDESPRLAAVITGLFGNRAIFMVPGNAKPVVAKEGSQVSNFVVRSIEPGRVVVESAAGLTTYKPLFAGKTPPAGQSALPSVVGGQLSPKLGPQERG
jgi:hypothetical protein